VEAIVDEPVWLLWAHVVAAVGIGAEGDVHDTSLKSQETSGD